MEENATIARRRELRRDNIGKATTPPSSSLDASLKKNTGFIKKLKTSLSSDQLGGLLKDVRTLKIEKYFPEIASAFFEAKLKSLQEISVSAEVISAIHQLYGDTFTGLLKDQLTKNLVVPLPKYQNILAEQKEKEESVRVSRVRALFRLATELYLVGVLNDDGFFLDIFRSLVTLLVGNPPLFTHNTPSLKRI